jgi:uncharacterized protein (TIGR02217 family)
MLSTTIVVTAGGREKRNRNWSSSRRTYDLALEARKTSIVQIINAFFETVGGRHRGFRLKDWTDYRLSGQVCEAVSATVFQIRKAYITGSETQYRTIQKPVAGSVKTYVASALVTSGFTIDHTTGRLTFDVAPSQTPTVDCEFDVPVRFDQDQIKWTVFDRGPNGGEHFFNAESLMAVEIKGE